MKAVTTIAALALAGALTAGCAAQADVELPAPEAAGPVEGVVQLRLEVDANRRVTNVSVISEEPQGHGFADAATAAVREWEFGPNFKPGSYAVTVRYRDPVE